MNTIIKQISFLAVALFFIAFSVNAQSKTTKTDEMKTYVIEREIPGAGNFTAEQLKTISQTSCGVLKQMNDIEWIHSYVTGNKIYCIYRAKNEDLIREHAKKGGFPANSVSEVANVISPATAE
jgi:hypothetical protein